MAKIIEDKLCLICNKKCEKRKNEDKLNWEKRKYCSISCFYARNDKNQKTCLFCNNVFAKNKSHHFSKRKFCNIKCVALWREQQVKKGLMKSPNRYKFKKGELHYGWKGGITPINEAIRKSKEYCDWRKSVFERDNYTCLKCGKRGGTLNAHHIKKFADYPESRFEIDNGETLCVDCHYLTFEFHSNQYKGRQK